MLLAREHLFPDDREQFQGAFDSLGRMNPAVLQAPALALTSRCRLPLGPSRGEAAVHAAPLSPPSPRGGGSPLCAPAPPGFPLPTARTSRVVVTWCLPPAQGTRAHPRLAVAALAVEFLLLCALSYTAFHPGF